MTQIALGGEWEDRAETERQSDKEKEREEEECVKEIEKACVKTERK